MAWVGTGCWKTPRLLVPRPRLQLGLWWTKEIASDLLGGQSKEKVGTACSIVPHSRISQICWFIAYFCHLMLKSGMWKSSGEFLFSGLCPTRLQDPSHMAPKMGHLYLSLLLGFWFPFQSTLSTLRPPSRHFCHCLRASPLLLNTPSSPGGPALICDDIRYIVV